LTFWRRSSLGEGAADAAVSAPSSLRRLRIRRRSTVTARSPTDFVSFVLPCLLLPDLLLPGFVLRDPQAFFMDGLDVRDLLLVLRDFFDWDTVGVS
jgi:hypothetical protein